MFDRDDQEEQEEREPEEKKRRRKPRQAAEVIDLPRAYLVRNNAGSMRVVAASSKQEALAGLLLPGSGSAALMGTHENQAHAEKRLGWV